MKTTDNTDILPTLDQRKDMVEQQLKEWQNTGFHLSLRIAAIRVQKLTDSAEIRKRDTMLKDMELQQDNAYESARAMQKELDAILEEEQATKSADDDA